MSFRGRLALATAAAVALAVVLASAAVYLVVRNQLRDTVDAALESRAQDLQRVPLRAFRVGDEAFLEPSPALGGAPGVKSMFDTLDDELQLAMKLAGCGSIKDIKRKFVT